MNRATLSSIQELQREWRGEVERLDGQLDRGEITQHEYNHMKDIADQLYENQMDGLTGPQRL